MNNFWKSIDAKTYESFNISKSDYPAYKLAYHLLEPKNKIILDFGCYYGNSSQDLIQEGAKLVVGVDKSISSINVAKERFKKEKKLEFYCIPEEKDFSFNMKFDSCCMTFVHPTIDSHHELNKQFSKISKVLKQSGKLVILGLHKNSFKEGFSFVQYNHERRSVFKDGEPFKNELRTKSKNIIFNDFWWNRDTIQKLLLENGFSKVEFLDLDETLVAKEKVLEQAISIAQLDWIDEWKAPLYEIIIAIK